MWKISFLPNATGYRKQRSRTRSLALQELHSTCGAFYWNRTLLGVRFWCCFGGHTLRYARRTHFTRGVMVTVERKSGGLGCFVKRRRNNQQNTRGSLGCFGLGTNCSTAALTSSTRGKAHKTYGVLFSGHRPPCWPWYLFTGRCKERIEGCEHDQDELFDGNVSVVHRHGSALVLRGARAFVDTGSSWNCSSHCFASQGSHPAWRRCFSSSYFEISATWGLGGSGWSRIWQVHQWGWGHAVQTFLDRAHCAQATMAVHDCAEAKHFFEETPTSIGSTERSGPFWFARHNSEKRNFDRTHKTSKHHWVRLRFGSLCVAIPGNQATGCVHCGFAREALVRKEADRNKPMPGWKDAFLSAQIRCLKARRPKIPREIELESQFVCEAHVRS